MTRERVSFVLPGGAAVVSRLARRMLDQAGLDGVSFSVETEREPAVALDPVDVTRAELNRVSLLLIAEWERAERRKVNPSYVSTFVDMARVVIADRPRAPEPKEWDAERYDRGDVREDDGYESSDYVDGWNDALAARAQGSR